MNIGSYVIFLDKNGICGCDLPRQSFQSTNDTLTIRLSTSCFTRSFQFGTFEIVVAATEKGKQCNRSFNLSLLSYANAYILSWCTFLQCHSVFNKPHCEKAGLRGFPTRSDIKRAVQSQKIARGLKFCI